MPGGQKGGSEIAPAKAPADYSKVSAVAAGFKGGAALAGTPNSTILTSGLGDPTSAMIGKKTTLGQ